MTKTGERGMDAAGDAACVWHALDFALRKLCEARDSLEAVGLGAAVAEELGNVIDRVEDDYGEAERRLVKELEDDSETER